MISDSDHLKFMNEVSTALGRIEAGQKATHDYLDAVNVNVKAAKADFDNHEKDSYAHGIGLRLKVLAWVAGVPSALAGFLFGIKKLMSMGGGNG